MNKYIPIKFNPKEKKPILNNLLLALKLNFVFINSIFFKFLKSYRSKNKTFTITILVHDKAVSDYFEECIKLGADPKESSNWITSNILSSL